MPKTVPPVMLGLTHLRELKPCSVHTQVAVHTVTLEEGNFACIVSDRPDLMSGAIQILDRAEADAIIVLLRNAIEDAERLDRGLEPLHASPTSAVN